MRQRPGRAAAAAACRQIVNGAGDGRTEAVKKKAVKVIRIYY